MATINYENLAYVIELDQNYKIIDEPALLFLDNKLQISENESSINANLPKIDRIIKLKNQVYDDDVSNITFTETSEKKYLIYGESTKNLALSSDKLILTEKKPIIENKDSVEVVDITNLIKSGIIDEEDFIGILRDINQAITNLSKLQENVKEVANPEASDNTDVKEVATADEQNYKPNFKTLLTKFIQLTNEILSVPEFRKLISITQEIENSQPKIDKLKEIKEYYNKHEKIIKDVWENVNIDPYGRLKELKQYKDGNNDFSRVYNLINFDNFFDKLLENDNNNPDDNNNPVFVKLQKFVDFLYKYKNKSEIFIKDQEKESELVTEYEAITYFYDVIYNHINIITKFIDNKVLNDLKKGDSVGNIIEGLNILVRNRIQKNVLTFLKIRNDEHESSTYNKRFHIRTLRGGEKDKEKELLLQYNSDDDPYYIVNQDGNLFPDRELFRDNVKSNLNIEIKEYDHQYLFGEFTEIFRPHLKNKDIAERMDIVKEQLINDRKPVFIIGYGASGAGKTSSLIYLNDKKLHENDKNGVLIHLCNLMGKNGFTQVEVSFREFYNSDIRNTEKGKDVEIQKNDRGKGKTYIGPDFCHGSEKPIGINNDKAETVTFMYNEDNCAFYVKGNFHTINHTQRFKDIKKVGEETIVYDNSKTMGEVMIDLIDTDRNVKATLNNPNSSRSHSLIFVKFLTVDEKSTQNQNKDRPPILIVGDFAGVENEFDCKNDNVIDNFLKINKRDGKPFYQTENDDLIGNTNEINEGNVTKEAELPFFEPENPSDNFDKYVEYPDFEKALQKYSSKKEDYNLIMSLFHTQGIYDKFQEFINAYDTLNAIHNSETQNIPKGKMKDIIDETKEILKSSYINKTKNDFISDLFTGFKFYLHPATAKEQNLTPMIKQLRDHLSILNS